MTPQVNLLEHLRHKSTLLYLSDLHDPHYHRYVYQAVIGTPAEDFSLADWQKAVTYICGRGCTPDRTAVACRQQLLTVLYAEQK